ncbi:class I SAM-dependent methyltransferase [Beijerinckia indica]|uniref:Phosphatidylethanolamine N-methyltransferase n=1 Tax=Beijerinckia indica subsp. indica (strain ATCC 9039 / DSM 1715 / NCIMB 8712) TaxID=395963 RepID=B2IBH2_BEII9|nr:class I SAM-dependent methyltransferase [Beijerinckia indica]ACB96598.1 Phosphatidylethanolamine N-methyltransferase [Beijerinckia indica subsp. indica ATCC 9039]
MDDRTSKDALADDSAQNQNYENAHVEAAYARWAPIYDLVFEAVMRPGRKAAAAAIRGAAEQGGAILDVGVGTGLELPMFEKRGHYVGVDLSLPMLRRAQQRIAADNLSHVEGLAVMDAARLAFADAVFDRVVAPYVLTVLPDPWASLDEFLRVIKPGGEIVLVNHIGAEQGPVALVEAWLGRRSASLGWKPEFPWSIVGDWIAARPCRLLERRTLPPLGLFTLARIEKL